MKHFFLCFALAALLEGRVVAAAGDADAGMFDKTPILELPFMEITVPEPPTVLHAGGRRTLCYELYITNMFKKPFTLERVRVLDDDGKTLLESVGNSLLSAMHRAPGGAAAGGGQTAHSKDDPAVIKGAERVVFFAWVDLPEGSPVPKTIKHEVGFKPEKGDTLTIHAAGCAVRDSMRTIAPPLRGDYWYAMNGPSNTSHHRRGILAFDGKTYIGQRYAIDWSRVDRGVDEVYHGDAGENANYFCYGNEVYAVADGVISALKDGIPENKALSKIRAVPITNETVGGNYVMIDIGGGVFAYYAHLQPGKIRVNLGDRVKVGDVIGLLGNSGNSTAPHLHFQLCDGNSSLASQGVPYVFEKLTVAGHTTTNDQEQTVTEWFVQPQVRENQMPVAGEMISFPAVSREATP